MLSTLLRILLPVSLLVQAPAIHAQAELDASHEPRFMMIPKRDPKVLASVEAARKSLPEFRRLLKAPRSEKYLPSVKSFFPAGEQGIWLWLSVQEVRDDGFVAEVFEAPKELPALKVGKQLWIPDQEVADWMLNQAGEIHGGYSLRLQRERTPEKKRAEFDSYVGAKSYAPLPR